MNSQRPRLQIPWSRYEKLLEVVCLGALVWMAWILFQGYGALPEIIPTKFSLDGNLQALGSKSQILILPFLIVAIYLGLSILGRVPHLFNYLTTITEQNAFQQYMTARQLLNTMKTQSILLLTAILFVIVNQLRYQFLVEYLVLFLFFALACIFLTVFYFAHRLRKL